MSDFLATMAESSRDVTPAAVTVVPKASAAARGKRAAID